MPDQDILDEVETWLLGLPEDKKDDLIEDLLAWLGGH